MLLFRSTLYLISLYVASAIIVTVGMPFLLMPSNYTRLYSRFWSRVLLFLARVILGIRYEIIGGNNLPKECIVACKHQSAWETIACHVLVKDSSIVAKEELKYFPIFGWYIQKVGVLIRRAQGMKAIKQLISEGKESVKNGNPLLIFPEGTRSEAGVRGVYQPGIAALYTALDVPVVPVALNSGWFWPRKKMTKRPGKITVKFLDPIQPGLNRKDFMKVLEERIEEACVDLDVSAKKQLNT